MNFRRLSNADFHYVTLLALAAFLTQLALLHILRYNKTIAILATALTKSFSDVIGILFIILVFSSAFASFMYVVYGPSLDEYSSMMATYTALFSGSIGKFDFHQVIEAMGLTGSIVLLLFLLCIMYIYLNLFVTILSEYMSALRGDPSVVPNDHEVITHMLALMEFVFQPEKREKEQNQKKNRRRR